MATGLSDLKLDGSNADFWGLLIVMGICLFSIFLSVAALFQARFGKNARTYFSVACFVVSFSSLGYVASWFFSLKF